MKPSAFAPAALLLLAGTASACDLCAVYSASSARGESARGFLVAVSEQFIPFRTLQFEGEEFTVPNPDYLDSSITHLVPTYNFSSWAGLSLNVPVIYRSFKRSEIRFSPGGGSGFNVDKGTEFGLGDMSLIARGTVVRKIAAEYSVFLNVLAGVKFPTGDTERLEDEVEQTEIFDSLPGTPPDHDPLGHTISGVHQHDVSPGSGSFDGIFGVTLNTRWRRWLFSAQFQYYLRTEGETTFEYGDELMVSGGPGGYLVFDEEWTLSLQLNAAYDTMARDSIDGRKSDLTGRTAWYLGPLLNLTVGKRFSLNAGVDVPLSIANNGFQNVPDYVVHGGFSVRF